MILSIFYVVNIETVSAKMGIVQKYVFKARLAYIRKKIILTLENSVFEKTHAPLLLLIPPIGEYISQPT